MGTCSSSSLEAAGTARSSELPSSEVQSCAFGIQSTMIAARPREEATAAAAATDGVTAVVATTEATAAAAAAAAAAPVAAAPFVAPATPVTMHVQARCAQRRSD